MRRFIHRHQPPVPTHTAVIAGLGGAIAIAALALVTDYLTLALLIAPFGASCVLLFAAPSAPLSQPANVVAGHVLSAAIGLGVFASMPAGVMASGLAVGLAVAAMLACRIVHPPAGATALVAATAKSVSFLLFPVLAGAVALVALATAYHRIVGNVYPLPIPKSAPPRN